MIPSEGPIATWRDGVATWRIRGSPTAMSRFDPVYSLTMVQWRGSSGEGPVAGSKVDTMKPVILPGDVEIRPMVLTPTR